MSLPPWESRPRKILLRCPERSHRNSRHPRYDSYFRSDKIISTWKWRTQPYVASVVSQKFAYELSVPTMHGGRKLASAVPPDCSGRAKRFSSGTRIGIL